MSTEPDTTTDVLDVVDDLHDQRAGQTGGRGDSRVGDVYIVSKEIRTALKVALLTGRPLLLGGPPGCGKSSLASYVARNLGVEYYEFVATDDVRATDLTWRLDTVRRLGDAQANRLDRGGRASIAPYIEPGPLWWALNRPLAQNRGLDELPDGVEPATATQGLPNHSPTRAGAVLLIDEVDKADSAFCNGLLVPLGSRQTFVPSLDLTVNPEPGAPAWSPLTIITTNNERDLPEAFLRRCVVLRLAAPTEDDLVKIVDQHFPDLPEDVRSRVGDLAKRVAGSPSDERPVSSAEFLDLVRVVWHMMASDSLDDETLETVMRITLDKHEVYGRRDRMWSA